MCLYGVGQQGGDHSFQCRAVTRHPTASPVSQEPSAQEPRLAPDRNTTTRSEGSLNISTCAVCGSTAAATLERESERFCYFHFAVGETEAQGGTVTSEDCTQLLLVEKGWQALPSLGLWVSVPVCGVRGAVAWGRG